MLDTEVTSVNWESKSLSYHTLGKQMKSEQYDYLVLATGLRSRKLPPSIRGGDLRNIFYLRSMEDANNLVSQYPRPIKWKSRRISVASIFIVDKVKASETKNITIIGDSFIALELCGWLTTGLAGPDGKQEDKDKKNVTVVMLLKAPMIRKRDEDHEALGEATCFVSRLGIFGERVARAVQKVHEKNGAKFYPEANVTEISVSISCCSRLDRSISMDPGWE